jgi:hypothetical protein
VNPPDAAEPVAETGNPADQTGVGMPMLVSVKSAPLHCPDCHKLLVRSAPPGTVADCRYCKREVLAS